jgi:hypothetical protein
VTLAAIIPMAFVMIAGPQIITSFLLATSKDWAKNSFAYVSGAAASITALVSVAFFVAHGVKSASSDPHHTDHVIDWIIFGLIVVLAARVFLTRKSTHPPKWMEKLQGSSARFALALGLVLLGVMPTDILTAVTAGLHVARHGDSWWQCLPFIAATLVLLGTPALLVVALGKRARTVVPAVRDWMTNNSWIVSEIVLAFFAAITINSLVQG